jgi:hypothetical protein
VTEERGNKHEKNGGLQVQKVGLVVEIQERWRAWSQGGGYGMVEGGGVEHRHGRKCI